MPKLARAIEATIREMFSTPPGTKKHEQAVADVRLVLVPLARSILRRFHMRTTDEMCEEAEQQCWVLLLEDRLSSCDSHYGVDKYIMNLMMRAVSRIADRGVRVRRRRSMSHANAVHSKLPTPSEKFENLQTIEEIRTELDRLKSPQRKLIIDVYYEDMSVKDAATERGITANAAELRLHRAREILRPRLRGRRQ